jgi:molybdopterin-binding protein
VAINATDVSVSLEKPKNISISNIFKGKISKIEPNAAKDAVVVHANTGSPIVAYISVASLKKLRLKEGTNVYFLIKAVSLLR